MPIYDKIAIYTKIKNLFKNIDIHCYSTKVEINKLESNARKNIR